MDLMQRVEELTERYGSDGRRAIGEFIMRERGSLGRYSLQEIADATYTSKAAPVRFAKALGFTGWKPFVQAFVAEQRYQQDHYSDIDPNYPFDENDRDIDIINKVCSLQVESILDTADLLDEAALTKAVALLQHANQIGVFGASPNSQLGALFRRKLQSMGRQVCQPNQGDFGLAASTLKAGDCAVIISYSGSSKAHDPVSAAEILARGGVPIIAITSAGDNYLRQLADCTLTISSRERLYSKISTFATENSILYLLNVLFSCLFARDYRRNLDYKITTARQLEAQRVATLPELRESEIL